jgi:hypothetical protein
MSASDPPLSQLSPPGYEQTVFLQPNLPDGPFMLMSDDPDEWQDGPFDPQDFNTDPMTNILYSHNGDGHPVFLRVLNQQGPVLTLVDGQGEVRKWIVREIPDNVMAVEDPFTPDAQIMLQQQQELRNG